MEEGKPIQPDELAKQVKPEGQTGTTESEIQQDLACRDLVDVTPDAGPGSHPSEEQRKPADQIEEPPRPWLVFIGSITWWLNRALRPMGIFTLVIAGTGILQFFIVRDQLRVMDGTLWEMRQQSADVKTAVDALNNISTAAETNVAQSKETLSQTIAQHRESLTKTIAQGKATSDASIKAASDAIIDFRII